MIIAFFKPYGVLSQFTPEHPTHRTLAEFGFPPRVYPVGRLDRDSEGLLILSDEAWIVPRLLEPRYRHPRTYLALVEGIPSTDQLNQLRRGITIKGGYRTRPCIAYLLDAAPPIPDRFPPVRYRKTVPDRWVQITLTEGKNRQVRRMFAAIGHPVLRLIRVAIGQLTLQELGILPGQWKVLERDEIQRLLAR
ncbi:MAG: pseudouridine synthase [Bacteroidota bacterium]|nr:pseudouridine synthase [Candidatus Kapabacteria bacterium]MCS7302042.1 pseudouridine synthase [Candidatus Kapabacteria bacterium]MCX7936842.1 pseudouridine synthase [Chlorobiota bacterium]MDW8074561.1 pseudouridine synthase [Bacteroidota bacterium]